MALAERLHMPDEVIESWSMARIMRWIAYDEVNEMITRARDAFKTTYEEAVNIVREEQANNGWRGLYKREDSE